MNNLSSNLAQISPVLVALLALILLVLLVWLTVLQRRAARLEVRLDDLFGDGADENVGRMLAEYLTTVRGTASAVSRIKSEHDEMAAIVPSAIRHVGLVRFSPFHDTGGDQSFALALLNGRGDGVVVTALHSRNDSRLYAKPVEHGSSSYSLSPEEREAMEHALGRQMAEAQAR